MTSMPEGKDSVVGMLREARDHVEHGSTRYYDGLCGYMKRDRAKALLERIDAALAAAGAKPETQEPVGYVTSDEIPEHRRAQLLPGAIVAAGATLYASPSPAYGSAEGASLPAGWVPLTIDFDAGYPEEVAYGPQFMMDRLKKWLDKFYAMRAAEGAKPAVQGETPKRANLPSDADVLEYADQHGLTFAEAVLALATPLPAQVQPAEQVGELQWMCSAKAACTFQRQVAPHQPVSAEADETKVICPACVHQFRAIPVQVQQMMLAAGFEPPFDTAPQVGAERQALVDWVAERWHAEVANRPLVNRNRRPLDDAWRQMLRHLGVDDRARLGPTHDELLTPHAHPAEPGKGANHG